MSKFDIPGPGSYNAAPENVKKKVIAYKLGTGSRDWDHPSTAIFNLTPGPGTYDQRSLIGKDAP
jgi:hypothetical protein